jgi:hypothetical protein
MRYKRHFQALDFFLDDEWHSTTGISTAFSCWPPVEFTRRVTTYDRQQLTSTTLNVRQN